MPDQEHAKIEFKSRKNADIGDKKYNSVAAAQDDLLREKKRKDFELWVEKSIKRGFVVLFWLSLSMVVIVLGFYVYYLVFNKVMPNELRDVTQILIGVAVGNLVGSVAQNYLRDKQVNNSKDNKKSDSLEN